MTPYQRFQQARDFLQQHRTDYDTAVRDYQAPQLDSFNWALDFFDTEAKDNHNAALWVVAEDGSEQIAAEVRGHVPACLVLGETAQRRALQPGEEFVVRRAIALGAPCRQAGCQQPVLQAPGNGGEDVAQRPVVLAPVDACQQPGSLDDLSPPACRVVATAAQAAAQFRHHADGVIDSPCHP